MVSSKQPLAFLPFLPRRRALFLMAPIPYAAVRGALLADRTSQRHRPGKGHTELEEELHETAHIDYERVAIVRKPLMRPCRVNSPCRLRTMLRPLGPIDIQYISSRTCH